jgi:hypothetical protein
MPRRAVRQERTAVFFSLQSSDNTIFPCKVTPINAADSEKPEPAIGFDQSNRSPQGINVGCHKTVAIIIIPFPGSYKRPLVCLFIRDAEFIEFFRRTLCCFLAISGNGRYREQLKGKFNNVIKVNHKPSICLAGISVKAPCW